MIADYRNAGLTAAALAGVLLSVALVLEHGFYMDPCPLCLTQRVFFILAGLCALLSLLPQRPSKLAPVGTVLMCAGGIWFAVRQLYLYTLPADQIPACTAPINRLIEYAPLSELLTAMTMGTGNCAEASFPIFGMELPGISIPLGSLVGFLLILWLVSRQYRSLATAAT